MKFGATLLVVGVLACTSAASDRATETTPAELPPYTLDHLVALADVIRETGTVEGFPIEHEEVLAVGAIVNSSIAGRQPVLGTRPEELPFFWEEADLRLRTAERELMNVIGERYEEFVEALLDLDP